MLFLIFSKQEEMHIMKSVQPPSLSNVVHVSNAVQSNGEGSVTLNNCHTFDFQPNLAFSLCDMEKVSHLLVLHVNLCFKKFPSLVRVSCLTADKLRCYFL